MADIALITADKIEIVEIVPGQTMTLPAGEALTAGQLVRINASGQFIRANGTTATTGRAYGVVTRSVSVAGPAVTAIKKGVMDGFEVSALAYDADLFASNTPGMLADAAGTTPKVIGKVIPVWSQVLAGVPNKIVLVDL